MNVSLDGKSFFKKEKKRKRKKTKKRQRLPWSQGTSWLCVKNKFVKGKGMQGLESSLDFDDGDVHVILTPKAVHSHGVSFMCPCYSR